MNCRSVSIMAGHFFLIQPKLILLAIFYSNYLCYDFDARVFIFLDIWYFFCNFLIIGILIYYTIIDSCIGIKKCSMVHEKSLEFKVFDTLFSHFSTYFFLYFACVCCCFYRKWILVMSYWWIMKEKRPCCFNEAWLRVFISFHGKRF